MSVPMIGGPADGQRADGKLRSIQWRAMPESPVGDPLDNPRVELPEEHTYLLEELRGGGGSVFFYRHERTSLIESLSRLVRRYPRPER